MKKLLLACVLTLSASAPALADQAAADKCAAGLDANGQAIYAAAAPQAASASDLRGLVTDTTKALVGNGTVPRDVARGAAQAAGACLQKLR
ncbi:hypothetical protein [Xanthobacter sediminis]